MKLWGSGKGESGGNELGDWAESYVDSTCSHTCCTEDAASDAGQLASKRGLTDIILHCTLLACCSREFCVELKKRRVRPMGGEKEGITSQVNEDDGGR